MPSLTNLIMPLLIMAGGLTLLVAGGETLVAGAGKLARRWGMSPLLIGLTIVAFGTSLPELFVSLTAVRQGFPDIMIGNVIGSNIANIGLILGFCALLAPLNMGLTLVVVEMKLLLVASAVLCALAAYGFFPRPFGLLFVVTLVVYTFRAYHLESRAGARLVPGEGNEGGAATPPGWRDGVPMALCQVAGGLIALAYGSEMFIDGAVRFARLLGISELLIGLTLAAVGTSLPELATCLSAIRRRHTAMLVGNIIGSNLFNLLMVMGATSLFYPFAMSPTLLLRDLPLMVIFSLALFFCLRHYGEIRRLHGGLMLAGYLAYLALLTW